MFTLAQLKTSVRGADALSLEAQVGKHARRRQTGALPVRARPRGVPLPSAVPIGPAGLRLEALQQARAAEGSETAPSVTKSNWNAQIAAELRSASGTPWRPALTGREAQAPPPFPPGPSPGGCGPPPVGAAASRQLGRRKASWESRAGRTRGRSAAERL